MENDINKTLYFRKHRGGNVVVHNDYQYHKIRDFVNGQSIWRCSSYKKCNCPATITIKGTELIKQGNRDHACAVSEGRLMVAREIDNLKQKVVDSNKPIPQLYEESCEEFINKGLNFVAPMPQLSSVKHALYDMRNKTLEVKKTYTKKFEEVEIPTKYDNFVLADYYYEGSRILLFSSPECRQIMGQIDEMFGDATFKSCPGPFSELYSIHGEIGSTNTTTKVVPLVFALLPDKKQATYEILFDLIKSTIPEWSPSIFHCDFELAAINAIIKKFPDIELKGCYYHWSRAIWKKAKALKFNSKKGQKRIIGLTSVLPLLPAEDILQGWEYVKEESKGLGMQPFIKYVERFWLQSKLPFHKMLSAYGMRHRTNNVLEGWHSKLNRRTTKGTVTVTRLLEILKAFQKSKMAQKQARGANRTKVSISNDDYIASIMLQFISGDISVGYTLDKLR